MKQLELTALQEEHKPMPGQEQHSRRDVIAAAAALAATAVLGACAHSDPIEIPNVPTPEAVGAMDKKAFELMYKNEAYVIEQCETLLKPVQSERPIIDPAAGLTSRLSVVEHMQRSADVERQAATDMVGSRLVVQHVVKDDQVHVTLSSYTTNSENNDLRTENHHSATWLVEDNTLKQLLIDGLVSCGELLGRIKYSSTVVDRDIPNSSSGGLLLTVVSVSADHVPEDSAAGYEGTQQYITRDEKGLCSTMWTFQDGGKTQKMQEASAVNQPDKFNALVEQFATHAPYAQKAIAAAVGKI